jgi:hypothetical protein
MRTQIGLTAMLVSTLTLAGAAMAQPQGRLTDLEFVKVSRCAGLADGTDNAKTLSAYIDRESRGRGALAQDRADQARREASLQIHAARGERLQRLSAERDACSTAVGAN